MTPETPYRTLPGGQIELPTGTVGYPTECKSCHARIVWGLTKNGKRAPFDLNGMSHFTTCPDARKWTKKGKSA